ncbi:hypothetical protein [Asticcacaulis solisilvae]|uniref:hypothetical protein n=1 Tax=Asticcacaulis solisilvae TaxID=1217274 RepID=UPI003FD82EC5
MARDFVDTMLFLVERGEVAADAAVDALISTISEGNGLLSRAALGELKADMEKAIDDFRHGRASRDYTVLVLSSTVRSGMARHIIVGFPQQTVDA